jgi:hypothetical protein
MRMKLVAAAPLSRRPTLGLAGVQIEPKEGALEGPLTDAVPQTDHAVL